MPKRFEAYGWQVIPNVDGHDVEAVDRAIRKAQAREIARPTLICCKTVIGKGAPHKANTGAAHGAPLGAEEIAATRAAIGWRHPPFEIPQDVYAGWDARGAGKRAERRWSEALPGILGALSRGGGRVPAPRRRASCRRTSSDQVRALIAETHRKAETIATRKASQNALESLAPVLPELVGGSADLTGSNLTMVKGSQASSRREGGGNYLFYGVREFGMCAIMNGIALHGGFIPYGGTFLVFSDYARNALRMAALMRLRAIYVFTHDSIGLGEDGPTHQPVEHAAAPAPDPEHGRLAPLRHGRVGGGLDRRARAPRRPERAAVLAPERRLRAAQRRGARAGAPRRLRALGRAGRRRRC